MGRLKNGMLGMMAVTSFRCPQASIICLDLFVWVESVLLNIHYTTTWRDGYNGTAVTCSLGNRALTDDLVKSQFNVAYGPRASSHGSPASQLQAFDVESGGFAAYNERERRMPRKAARAAVLLASPLRH